MSFVPFSLAAELTIYSTTDIHSYIYNYDYYSGKDTKYGLAVVASLLEADRPPAGAVLLVDNGDLIQGTPLASYYAPSHHRGHECLGVSGWVTGKPRVQLRTALFA